MSKERSRLDPTPYLLCLQKKLADLEEPPDKNLTHIEKLVLDAEPPLSIDDGWSVNPERFVLKDREPLQIKGRRRQIVYGSVYSRLKALPLKISAECQFKSFVEVSLGINYLPSRKDFITKSSGEPIILDENYKKDVKNDNSIKLALYFYGPDTLSLNAFFKCKVKSVDKAMLTWTQNLTDYTPYLSIKLRKPRRLESKGRSNSAPKPRQPEDEETPKIDFLEQVATGKPTTPSAVSGQGSSINRIGRLETIMLKAGVRMQNKTQEKLSKTLGSFDITRKRQTGANSISPKIADQLIRTTPAFFPKVETQQNISPELATSTRGFFIRLSDRKQALKGKVAEIEHRIDFAHKKRDLLVEESKQHTLQRIEDKRRKVEIKNKIIKETMSQLVTVASIKAWVLLLTMYEVIFFSERRIVQILKSRKNMRVFLKCSMFIGKLIFRMRMNRKNKPIILRAHCAVVFNLVTSLRLPRIQKSSSFVGGRCLQAMCVPWILLHKCYKFKNKMNSTCQKLFSHFKRKRVLRDQFLEGLRHCCSLLDRKRNQVTYTYSNFDPIHFLDYFEVSYQLKLNEAWMRQVELMVSCRSAIVKKNLARHPKFKEAIDRLASRIHEEKLFKMKGYDRYEYIEHYLQVNQRNIESIVQSLVKNISMFGGFSGSLSGLQLRDRGMPTTMPEKQQKSLQRSRSRLVRAAGGFFVEEISFNLGFADFVGLLLGATDYTLYLQRKVKQQEEEQLQRSVEALESSSKVSPAATAQ